MNRTDKVIELSGADEVVEIESCPAWFDRRPTFIDTTDEGITDLFLQAEQHRPVGASTRAPPPGLDSEEIIQQSNDEVVMDELIAVSNQERGYREPIRIGIADDLDLRIRHP